MTILINQTELQQTEQLPDNIQLLLEMIPQGTQWVQMMLAADTKDSVSFPSPASFIEQLSLGLRGTSLLYFDAINLTVDIKKLLEVSDNDLRALAQFTPATQATQGSTSPQSVDSFLQRNQLLSNKAFNTISHFLAAQPQPDLSLIWSATFNESLLFHDTLSYCKKVFSADSEHQSQAIQWAYNQAQTLSELGDYYGFYLNWRRYDNAKALPIETLLAQLSSQVLANLDCPTVTYELDQKGLQDAIVQWYDADNKLGFNRFSAGLFSLALHLDLSQVDQIEEQVNTYLTQLQQNLSTYLASDSFINQAGQYRHYHFALPTQDLLLNLDRIGCLSLYFDRPQALAESPAQGKKTVVSANVDSRAQAALRQATPQQITDEKAKIDHDKTQLESASPIQADTLKEEARTETSKAHQTKADVTSSVTEGAANLAKEGATVGTSKTTNTSSATKKSSPATRSKTTKPVKGTSAEKPNPTP